jgi:hypothetical protein
LTRSLSVLLGQKLQEKSEHSGGDQRADGDSAEKGDADDRSQQQARDNERIAGHQIGSFSRQVGDKHPHDDRQNRMPMGEQGKHGSRIDFSACERRENADGQDDNAYLQAMLLKQREIAFERKQPHQKQDGYGDRDGRVVADDAERKQEEQSEVNDIHAGCARFRFCQ